MKKLLQATTLAFLILTSSAAVARDTYVQGYTRSNGTYVQPHYRSAPNSTVQDNYSFQGNSNPYTGSTGSNTYQHDVTSPYFNGAPNSQGNYGHSYNPYRN